MFFLRILSFLAGGAVLLGAPFLLLSERAGVAFGNIFLVLLATLAVCVFAGAYFYIAMVGHRAPRSPRIRKIAAGLIGFQVLAGIVVLAVSQHVTVLSACGVMMCISVFLFLACVYPGELPRTHRPMRRRDASGMLPN